MSEPDDELLARALLNRPAAVIIRCQNTNCASPWIVEDFS
jgi:hypothetical protein